MVMLSIFDVLFIRLPFCLAAIQEAQLSTVEMTLAKTGKRDQRHTTLTTSIAGYNDAKQEADGPILPLTANAARAPCACSSGGTGLKSVFGSDGRLSLATC
jgi:hypothetical protein